jgi:hypothetical protein
MMAFFNVGGLPGPFGHSIYYPNCLLRNLCEARAKPALAAMNVAAIRPQPITARGMRASDPRIARMEAFDDLTVVGTASLLAA